MTEARIKVQAASTSSPISLSRGAILIRDPAMFGQVGSEPCERFLSRALEIAEIRSLTVDRVAGTVSIRHAAARTNDASDEPSDNLRRCG